jgi:hypothetical protein
VFRVKQSELVRISWKVIPAYDSRVVTLGIFQGLIYPIVLPIISAEGTWREKKKGPTLISVSPQKNILKWMVIK